MLKEQETTPEPTVSEELLPGTALFHGQFHIVKFLNSGGFGMTYLARDSLERLVVIKECFPAALCRRAEVSVRPRSKGQEEQFHSVVAHFVREARRLSKLSHPNIVGVHQVFEDNGTAYMALDLVEGLDLLDVMETDRARLGPDQIRQLLIKVLDAVEYIHENKVLHRDISPDNILLNAAGDPVLIDFGAAREEVTDEGPANSALLVIKDGYSPQEFYVSGGVQGPASDLYALGATIYHLVTGEIPPGSKERLAAAADNKPDPYVPLETGLEGYDDAFVNAVNQALNLMPQDRIQTAHEWRIAVDAELRQQEALARARADDAVEQSISEIVSATNRAVEQELKNPPAPKQKERPQPRYRVMKPEPVKKFDWEFDDPEDEADVDGTGETINEMAEDGAGFAPMDTENGDAETIPAHGEEDLAEPKQRPRGLLRVISRPVSALRLLAFGKSRDEEYGKAGL